MSCPRGMGGPTRNVVRTTHVGLSQNAAGLRGANLAESLIVKLRGRNPPTHSLHTGSLNRRRRAAADRGRRAATGRRPHNRCTESFGRWHTCEARSAWACDTSDIGRAEYLWACLLTLYQTRVASSLCPNQCQVGNSQSLKSENQSRLFNSGPMSNRLSDFYHRRLTVKRSWILRI